MSDRSKDWLLQAERNLEQSEASARDERHEWACFAAQQAAEMAVKALHLSLNQEAWGHLVARLLAVLPFAVSEDITDQARVLDNFYIPTQYPNGHSEGAPYRHYGKLQSREAINMPVRSLNTSVHRWPNRDEVHRAVVAWSKQFDHDPTIIGIGYFGSYANGTNGVGSDVDLIVVLSESSLPFVQRASQYDTLSLPVPADLLVYTEQELSELMKEGGRFAHVLRDGTVWMKEPGLLNDSKPKEHT